MRKILITLSVLLLIICIAMERAAGMPESWMRTEDNGIVHPVDYLHELAETEPRKARDYLGKSVSFVAPFEAIEENVRLDYYGRISCIVRLSVPGGRSFWVESEDAESRYSPGELLKVSGRVTGLSPSCVLLLNVVGTPGYPNNIKIEKIK